MAQMNQMDNMLTVGLIINTLPTEIKYLIISHIPIKNLVSYHDTEVNPIIDNYIKHYIDTKFLTDASTFVFLRKTNLYKDIIYIKIRTFAETIAKDFIQMCDNMKDLPVSESTERFVSLTIMYRLDGPPFKIQKNRYNYKIGDITDRMFEENYGIFTVINDRVFEESYDSLSTFNMKGLIYTIKMKEEYIITKIMNNLIFAMLNSIPMPLKSNESDFQLDSIKLVGFTKEDTLGGDVCFVKKYY
jgi:hypothetical protein